MSSACFKSITNTCGAKLKANPKPHFCEEEASLFTPCLPPKPPTCHRLIFQDRALLPVSCMSPRVTQRTHTRSHTCTAHKHKCAHGAGQVARIVTCGWALQASGRGWSGKNPGQPSASSRRAPQSQAWLHKVHSLMQNKKGKSAREERLSFLPAMRPLTEGPA